MSRSFDRARRIAGEDEVLGGPDDVEAERIRGHGDVADVVAHPWLARPGAELRQGDAEAHHPARACISNVLRSGPSRPRRMKAW